MKRMVKYAIMQYVPNYERDEKINIGVILHSIEDNYLSMKLIDNWKRLEKFDDEIDIDFMKTYLRTMRQQFEFNISNSDEIDIKDKKLIDNITQYYFNQFSFKISEIMIESSCNQFLEMLKNNYLYFDIEKKKRVSKKDNIEFFEELLKGRNIQYDLIGSNNSLIGNYNEKINVDFKIGNKYYKIINFNDSNVPTYIPTIKMWMMNALELKEKKQELIFVVNEQIVDEKINTFIKMLQKYGKVMQLSEFDNYF